jgi:hypothetical protein
VKIEFPESFPLKLTRRPDSAFKTRLDELVEAGICNKIDFIAFHDTFQTITPRISTKKRLSVGVSGLRDVRNAP